MVRDRTAVSRMRRYRDGLRQRQVTARVEVLTPVAATDLVKQMAAILRRRIQAAEQAHFMPLALSTINAPRPVPIDAATLITALLSPSPIVVWQPHIEALFDEVSIDVLHELVLAGAIRFEELYRATRTWRLTHASTADWIREMADLSLATIAAPDH